MVNTWTVTTEKLDSSAAIIEEKTAKYDSEWQKLYTELAAISSDQWKGIANQVFNEKLRGYENDFREMSNILRQYAEFLKTAAKNYRDTEEALQSEAQNLYIGK